MRDTSEAIHRDAVQPRGRAGPLLAAIRKPLAGMVETLLRWQELPVQRRKLLELDARMLKDIGISRADAVREAKRPFWDQCVYTVSDRKPTSSAGCTSATPVVCGQR